MDELTFIKSNINENRLFAFMNNSKNVHKSYYRSNLKNQISIDEDKEFSFKDMVMDFFEVEEEDREYFSVPLLFVSAAVHAVFTIR